MSKKDAAVYLRAAELIDLSAMNDHVASCWAVDVAASGGSLKDAVAMCAPERIPSPSPQRRKYNSTFAPTPDLQWRWGEDWPDPVKCRILALCFAAAMAESGDL